MQNPLNRAGVPAHELWWTMFLARTLELASVLPPFLVGRVQFEVELRDGTVERMFLDLRGRNTRGGTGSVLEPEVFVRTSDAKLYALMFAERAPKDALLVSGNARLFHRLLGFLEGAGAKKSLVQLRCAS